MPSPQIPPAKHWVFTLNNPTVTPEQLLLAFADWDLAYAVFQQEVGASGTVHFQGYLEFNARRRLTAIRKLPHSDRMHLEKRRGTREEARAYAMKQDTRDLGPYEFGQWVAAAQGKRSDLSEFCDALKSGKSIAEVAEEMTPTYVRYHRGLTSFLSLRPVSRPEPPVVSLYYGPPGCGKTKSFYDVETAEDSWVSPPGCAMSWFDGYIGQSAILLDDFDGKASKVPLSTLLQVLDRYPIRVPVKGGFTWFVPKRVYVTTNIHPSEWYDWSGRLAQFKALQRRFTVVHFWKETSPTETERFSFSTGDPGWDAFWDRML